MLPTRISLSFPELAVLSLLIVFCRRADISTGQIQGILDLVTERFAPAQMLYLIRKRAAMEDGATKAEDLMY